MPGVKRNGKKYWGELPKRTHCLAKDRKFGQNQTGWLRSHPAYAHNWPPGSWQKFGKKIHWSVTGWNSCLYACFCVGYSNAFRLSSPRGNQPSGSEIQWLEPWLWTWMSRDWYYLFGLNVRLADRGIGHMFFHLLRRKEFFHKNSNVVIQLVGVGFQYSILLVKISIGTGGCE